MPVALPNGVSQAFTLHLLPGGHPMPLRGSQIPCLGWNAPPTQPRPARLMPPASGVLDQIHRRWRLARTLAVVGLTSHAPSGSVARQDERPFRHIQDRRWSTQPVEELRDEH